MEKKFTPGPWFYEEESDNYTHIVRPVNHPGRIIHQSRQNTSGESEATARLIAAAPDLLEALERMCDKCNKYNLTEIVPEYEAARDAIAKVYEWRWKDESLF